MTDVLERLKEEKIPFLLCGYSSLDRYFRVGETGPLYLATDASLVSLAKAFDDLQFPGLPLEDASVQGEGRRLVFRCVDSLSVPPAAPFSVLRLLYDPGRNAFIDRLDMYPDLRAPGLGGVRESSPAWLPLCEAARLVSRYHYTAEAPTLAWGRGDELPPPAYQRDLLVGPARLAQPGKGPCSPGRGGVRRRGLARAGRDGRRSPRQGLSSRGQRLGAHAGHADAPEAPGRDPVPGPHAPRQREAPCARASGTSASTGTRRSARRSPFGSSAGWDSRRRRSGPWSSSCATT